MEQLIREGNAQEFFNTLGFTLYDDIPNNAQPPYAVIVKTSCKPTYFFNAVFCPVDFNIDIYAVNSDKIVLRDYLLQLQKHFQTLRLNLKGHSKNLIYVVEQEIQSNPNNTTKASIKTNHTLDAL